jgi:isopentenyl diphosphate isomerase/L-lactate dehydrogenase-like FMN-dependent dehydrogenase
MTVQELRARGRSVAVRLIARKGKYGARPIFVSVDLGDLGEARRDFKPSEALEFVQTLDAALEGETDPVTFSLPGLSWAVQVTAPAASVRAFAEQIADLCDELEAVS